MTQFRKISDTTPVEARQQTALNIDAMEEWIGGDAGSAPGGLIYATRQGAGSMYLAQRGPE